MIERQPTDALLRAALDETCDPLSDLERARIGARIQKEIANEAPISEKTSSRGVHVALIAVGAAACVAVGFWLGRSGGESPKGAPVVATDEQPEKPAPTPEVVPPAVPSTDRVVHAKANQRVAVKLGAGELTLIGPAEVTIDEAQPDLIRVSYGTVLGESPSPLKLEVGGKVHTTGKSVGIRVVRGTVVASAATKVEVREVFSLELGKAETAPTKVQTPEPTLAPPGLEPTIEIDAAPVPAGPTAAELYAASEAAMKRGELAVAKAKLERLVANHPASKDAGVARYDLALLAHRGGRLDEALTRLDAILADPGLAAHHGPAKRLRCRVVAKKNGEDASDC